jgi:hypothetical protein
MDHSEWNRRSMAARRNFSRRVRRSPDQKVYFFDFLDFFLILFYFIFRSFFLKLVWSTICPADNATAGSLGRHRAGQLRFGFVAVSAGHIWPVHLVWMTARLQQDTFLSWHHPINMTPCGHVWPWTSLRRCSEDVLPFLCSPLKFEIMKILLVLLFSRMPCFSFILLRAKSLRTMNVIMALL